LGAAIISTTSHRSRQSCWVRDVITI